MLSLLFHTFQLKEDKPLRVVIRNLHPTTSTELIKSELKMHLFEVSQVSSTLHKVNKHPLPLFFMDLERIEPTDQSNDIYNLASLLHTLIKVEEPYKHKTINQYVQAAKITDTLNPIVVIQHTVSAAVLKTRYPNVQTPETPIPSAHFVPETIL